MDVAGADTSAVLVRTMNAKIVSVPGLKRLQRSRAVPVCFLRKYETCWHLATWSQRERIAVLVFRAVNYGMDGRGFMDE